MKNNKKILMYAVLVTLLAALLLTACGGGTAGTTAAPPATTHAPTTTAPAAADTTTAPAAADTTTAPAETKAEAKATVSFTDSAGRTVDVPAEIKKVAPSGPLAQIVLYTAVPEKLAGIARAFGKSQTPYILESVQGLPEFGQFYGKNSTLNMETLLANAPDVIIDIGEAKKSVVEDMDNLQKQLNMPVVFIEAKLTDLPATYRKLAELVGEKERLEGLAGYAEKALAKAADVKAALEADDVVSVYWAMGEKGLNTNAADSFHSEVLQIVGAKNVADVEAVSSGAGSEVSFEQLLNWQPDVILFDTPALKETLEKDEAWQTLEAVKNGRTFVVPGEPYGLLANPPSVNRLLGIYWLGQTIYPEHYKLDLDAEFKTFYEQFYHHELSQENLDRLLGR